MKHLLYFFIIAFLFFNNNSKSQSFLFNGTPKPDKATVIICAGEKLKLEATGFSKVKFKLPLLFKSKYKWTTPDQKTKKDVAIGIDSVLVSHSGTYTITNKDASKAISITINVKPKPVSPEINYIINDTKLVVMDESSNLQANNSFKWELPDGSILKDAYGKPIDKKQIEVDQPKVSDLGKYKLSITDKVNHCAISAAKPVTLEHEVTKVSLDQVATKTVTKKSDTDTTQKDLFFFGNIGGNIDFINKKLGINSVYTDIQFRPELYMTKNIKIKFPIRIYYNNGSGPQQTDNLSPQNFTTIDSVTLASTKKVRIWSDKPVLTYKTENRNIGLNIPISFAYKLPNNDNWSLLWGLNLNFAWITNRISDFSYITRDSTVTIVDKTPTSTVPPVTSATITVPGEVTITKTYPVFYGTLPFRPAVPLASEVKYSQIYAGFQVGIEYQSQAYEFSLKYSLGNTVSYFSINTQQAGGYNHSLQLVFLEKTVGIQFFGDIHVASAKKYSDGSYRASSAPYYYFSLSKTINLGKIKELFFP